MKISIVIPTWEQHGVGTKHLSELLKTIQCQTFTNYDVIISDHSLDSDIQTMIKSCYGHIDIKYYRNSSKRGNGPANTNNSIKMADGDIIKIMFQDDLFYDSKALELIAEQFEKNNCKWLVNGCNHTTDTEHFTNAMVPSWNDRILYGNNTISSPSVLAFRNTDVELFDEELVMLMDCEYYYRLFAKHGRPTIISDILITNRIHKNQISSMYDNDINEEIKYVRNKYRE